MVGVLQPLSNNLKIINDDGTPTDYFIRWAQERQIDIGSAVSQAVLDAAIAGVNAHTINAGAGISGGGALSTNPTLSLNAGINLLTDVDTTTTPPTDGQALIWDDGDSLWVPGDVASGGSGSAPWSLISTNTISSAVANVDFTGLSGYTDLLIIFRNVTLSVSGQPSIRVSTDNGATYYSTSGDYVTVPASGIEAAQSFIALTNANATAARTAIGLLAAVNTTSAAKFIDRPNRDDSGSALFVANSSPINAIRALPGSGGNFNAGTIYLFGRPTSGGGGSYTLISEVTATGSETVVTFSSISSSYRHLEIWHHCRGTDASSDVRFNMTLNNDTGSNYAYRQQFNTTQVTSTSSTSAFTTQFAAASSTANMFNAGKIILPYYAQTTGHKSGMFSCMNWDGSIIRDLSGTWLWRDQSAISEIDLTLSAGALVSGSKVSLYGVT